MHRCAGPQELQSPELFMELGPSMPSRMYPFALVPAAPPLLQIKKAFSQRRKVVRNALRPLYEPGQVAAALAAAGLIEDARAQDLTLLQFGELAWRLQASGSELGPSAAGNEDGGGAEQPGC